MPQISFARLLLLFGVVALVFFTQLGTPRLWDRDEPRNSRASHEMLERGDWIVPTFNGELRDHKPILLYWGQMVSYSLIGESEFAARLPSALCAILTVLAVAVLATRLSGSRGINQEGFWAAGAMATCMLFVMAGRAATPDSCLIAFSTLGISALVIASITGAPPYASGNVGKAKWIPAMFGYTMLGLAVLAKGPVGLVLPMAVVVAWWMVCESMQRQSSSGSSSNGTSFIQSLLLNIWSCFNPIQLFRALWALRVLPGTVVCLLAAVPWYFAVGVETNGDFLRGFFWEHNVGRAMGSMEGHGGSIFFYPVAFLCGIFPWSLWLIPIGMWAKSAATSSVVSRQMVVLAVLWIGVYVSAFTIASTKLPSYITPCYAGAALLIGGYLRAFESTWSLPSLGWRRLAYGVTALTGIAIAGGLIWLAQSEQMPRLNIIALSGVLIVLLGVSGFVFEYSKRVAYLPAVWMVAAALFHATIFGFGASVVDAYRGDLQLLQSAQLSQQNEEWLSIGGLEPSWVHYLDTEIVEVREHPGDEVAWQKVEKFLNDHPNGLLIVAGEDANRKAGQSLGSYELERVSDAPRFLKTGELAVYRAKFPAQIANRDFQRLRQASDKIPNMR